MDRTTGKLEGLLALPAISMVVFLFLALIPKIDPRKLNIDQSAKAYLASGVVFGGIMLMLQILVVLAALGHNVNTTAVITAASGVMFIITGNLRDVYHHRQLHRQGPQQFHLWYAHTMDSFQRSIVEQAPSTNGQTIDGMGLDRAGPRSNRKPWTCTNLYRSRPLFHRRIVLYLLIHNMAERSSNPTSLISNTGSSQGSGTRQEF